MLLAESKDVIPCVFSHFDEPALSYAEVLSVNGFLNTVTSKYNPSADPPTSWIKQPPNLNHNDQMTNHGHGGTARVHWSNGYALTSTPKRTA